MIRNLSLYPAELRGLRSFQSFMSEAPQAQAEQNGASWHSAARQSHKIGHTVLKVAVPEGVHFARENSALANSGIRLSGAARRGGLFRLASR